MKPLLVVLLVASSVWAQSVADVARKERERQSKSRSTHIITSVEAIKVEEPKPTNPAAEQAKPAEQAKATEETKAAAPQTAPSKEAPKQQAPPPVDPVQVWNNQLNQLRTRIRSLMDQEASLLLQLNQANNQVYAPVTDPATQERALALVGQIQQQLEAVRKDLSETKTMLETMQLQGPPKK